MKEEMMKKVSNVENGYMIEKNVVLGGKLA